MAGVGQQVADHLMQPCPVAHHPDRLVGQVGQPPWSGAETMASLTASTTRLREVDPPDLEPLPLVEPRQQQHVADECRHATGLGLDARQRIFGGGGSDALS